MRETKAPGPGLPESLLWTAGFVAVQAISVVIAALLLLSANGAFEDLASNAAIVDELLRNDSAAALLVGAGSVLPVFLLIPLVLARSGRNWRARLRLVPARSDLVVLALGATIPLTIVAAAVRAGATRLFSDVGLDGGLLVTPEVARVAERFADGPFLLLVSVMALGPAITEEILFRGLIGRGLVARWGVIRGVLLASVLFAAVHFSPIYAMAVLPLGLFLHFVLLVTQSLKAAIVVHFANNLFVAAAIRFHLVDHLEVQPALVTISLAAIFAIVGLLWQHREGPHGEDSPAERAFAMRTQALAGTAVGGFTVLFVAAAL